MADTPQQSIDASLDPAAAEKVRLPAFEFERCNLFVIAGAVAKGEKATKGGVYCIFLELNSAISSLGCAMMTLTHSRVQAEKAEKIARAKAKAAAAPAEVRFSSELVPLCVYSSRGLANPS